MVAYLLSRKMSCKLFNPLNMDTLLNFETPVKNTNLTDSSQALITE